jgi:glutathione S-transferase
MKLYNYFRSSASFRVRIALELKGLPYDYVAVHLARGDHRLEAYRAISPDVLVPLLEVDGQHLSQSMAIIEYLDEVHPEPGLLPADPLGRARVRALAQYLVAKLHQDEDAKTRWYRHWVREGLESFERQLVVLETQRAQSGGEPPVYCYGNTPTLADCVLVPQIFNAKRYAVQLDGLPRTMAAFDACMQLVGFQRAQPENCPDFEA